MSLNFLAHILQHDKMYLHVLYCIQCYHHFKEYLPVIFISGVCIEMSLKGNASLPVSSQTRQPRNKSFIFVSHRWWH